MSLTTEFIQGRMLDSSTLIEHIDSPELVFTFGVDGVSEYVGILPKQECIEQHTSSREIYDRVGQPIKVTWNVVGGDHSNHVVDVGILAAHIHSLVDGEWIRIPQTIIETMFNLVSANCVRRAVHDRMSASHLVARYVADEMLTTVPSSVSQMPFSPMPRFMDGLTIVLDYGSVEQANAFENQTFTDGRNVVLNDVEMGAIETARMLLDSNYIAEFRDEFPTLSHESLISTVLEAIVQDCQFQHKIVIAPLCKAALMQIVNLKYNVYMSNLGATF